MENTTLELKIGEVKNVALPSHGAMGLMLVFDVEDSNVVDVSRKELSSEEVLAKVYPGDPVPAIFLIVGKKKGNTRVIFSEKRVSMPDSPNIGLVTVNVNVT